jgi:hypothetical protein
VTVEVVAASEVLAADVALVGVAASAAPGFNKKPAPNRGRFFVVEIITNFEGY